MILNQKILGSEIKLVLCGEGVVWVQVGQRPGQHASPTLAQVLSCLEGGGRHRSRLLGNRQWKPRAGFLGNKRVCLPIPAIPLRSEP